MSTTPPRNVIYCNDPGSLTEIAGMAYTDIILNFLAPGPDGNLTGPAPTPEQVQAMQNVGKNVLISLGGDPKTFASSDWQNYANDVNGLVQQVVAFVTSNGLNGVDIDYEDDNGFSTRDKNGNWAGPPVYDGVQLLIDLTNGLAQQLPPGSIITHAPQPPYFDPGAGYNPPGGTAPYTQIWEAAGNNISWVNCQFYNNSSYDDPADTKVASYGTIAGITSAPKLLVGAPVAAAAATSGYLPLDQFTSQVIGPLRQQYPGSFGGVTGWAFLYDQGGTWADGIGLALHASEIKRSVGAVAEHRQVRRRGSTTGDRQHAPRPADEHASAHPRMNSASASSQAQATATSNHGNGRRSLRSSREPTSIQKPSATERTLATRSEMTRSPPSSSLRTTFCIVRS